MKWNNFVSFRSLALISKCYCFHFHIVNLLSTTHGQQGFFCQKPKAKKSVREHKEKNKWEKSISAQHKRKKVWILALPSLPHYWKPGSKVQNRSAVMSWQSCIGVLSWQSRLSFYGCLSWLSCPCCPVPLFCPAVQLWLSCPSSPVLTVLSWQSCCLSCCPGSLILAILSWQSFHGSPVLAVLCW
jgi:hypothetical protein